MLRGKRLIVAGFENCESDASSLCSKKLHMTKKYNSNQTGLGQFRVIDLGSKQKAGSLKNW